MGHDLCHGFTRGEKVAPVFGEPVNSFSPLFYFIHVSLQNLFVLNGNKKFYIVLLGQDVPLSRRRHLRVEERLKIK